MQLQGRKVRCMCNFGRYCLITHPLYKLCQVIISSIGFVCLFVFKQFLTLTKTDFEFRTALFPALASLNTWDYRCELPCLPLLLKPHNLSECLILSTVACECGSRRLKTTARAFVFLYILDGCHVLYLFLCMVLFFP